MKNKKIFKTENPPANFCKVIIKKFQLSDSKFISIKKVGSERTLVNSCFHPITRMIDVKPKNNK